MSSPDSEQKISDHTLFVVLKNQGNNQKVGGGSNTENGVGSATRAVQESSANQLQQSWETVRAFEYAFYLKVLEWSQSCPDYVPVLPSLLQSFKSHIEASLTIQGVNLADGSANKQPMSEKIVESWKLGFQGLLEQYKASFDVIALIVSAGGNTAGEVGAKQLVAEFLKKTAKEGVKDAMNRDNAGAASNESGNSAQGNGEVNRIALTEQIKKEATPNKLGELAGVLSGEDENQAASGLMAMLPTALDIIGQSAKDAAGSDGAGSNAARLNQAAEACVQIAGVMKQLLENQAIREFITEQITTSGFLAEGKKKIDTLTDIKIN
ncbi:MAG: hypothetical protein ACOZAN_04905 [Patescibacteria group bacterium]